MAATNSGATSDAGPGERCSRLIIRFTQRTVALKIVAPDVPASQLSELGARLVREARALATPRHPGIVEVLDGGVLEDGTPYFVMEKLEGRTIEGLLAARTKLSAEETAAVTFQLCGALDVAHRRGSGAIAISSQTISLSCASVTTGASASRSSTSALRKSRIPTSRS